MSERISGSQRIGALDEADVMDQMILRRRSVRGFRAEPVAPELLREVFAIAQRAPSSCNIQPWSVHVVGGATAEAIRSALYEAAAAQRPLSPEIALSPPYEGAHRERQIAAAKALFEAQGVARDDVEGRMHSYLRNFRFFDAPHAAFIFLKEGLGMREAADCGMYIQTLMLAMAARGIASCPQGSLSHHAAVVRALLLVPADHRLLLGIAFGYQDDAHETNSFSIDRAPLEDAVTFHC